MDHVQVNCRWKWMNDGMKLGQLIISCNLLVRIVETALNFGIFEFVIYTISLVKGRTTFVAILVGYRFRQYYGPYRSIYYRYIIGISRNGICLNMFHKSKNFARILVYKIWKCHFKNQCFKCLLQKQKNIHFSP